MLSKGIIVQNYDINRNFKYWFEFTVFSLNRYNKMIDELKVKMYRVVCVCVYVAREQKEFDINKWTSNNYVLVSKFSTKINQNCLGKKLILGLSRKSTRKPGNPYCAKKCQRNNSKITRTQSQTEWPNWGYFEYSKDNYDPMNTKKTKFHEHMGMCNFMNSGIFRASNSSNCIFPQILKMKENKIFTTEKLETFQLSSDQHKNQ